MFQHFIGIDISKNWFDVHINHQVKRVPQSEIQTFLECHKDTLKNALCVMESTGGYETRLAQALDNNGISVHIAHPNQVSAFMKASRRLAKTDAKDARLLSEFGAFIKPHQIRPPVSSSQQKLKDFAGHLEDLKRMLHQQTCRVSHPKMQDSFLKTSSDAVVAALKNEIAKTEKEMLTQINQGIETKEIFKILTSMPGVGKISAMTLISQLPELGKLTKQEAAALVGVAPITRESGMKQGHARIQYGRGSLRKVLYMAALVACRCQGRMRDFYGRLRAKGKPAKVAIIAVLRKMVVTLNAMVKEGAVFRADVVRH